MKEYLIPLLAAAGTLLTALLTYLGVRYTQSQVSRAAREQTRLEETKVDAAAYQRARENYDAALDTLRDQVNDLEKARRSDHDEMDALRRRIEALERSRRLDRATIQALSSYIRELLRLLRAAGIQYPPPPPGLTDTDPDGWAPAT